MNQSAEEEEPVNYLDIKLQFVDHLPPEWLQGLPADSPSAICAQNPFRYEVSFDFPVVDAPTEAAEAPQPSAAAPAPAPAASAKEKKEAKEKEKEKEREKEKEKEKEKVVEPAPKGPNHHVFGHGRLLPSTPAYVQYVEDAAPPALPGSSEVNAIRDFPETMAELQQPGDALTDAAPPSAEEAPLQLLWVTATDEAPPIAAPDEKKARKKAQSVSSVVSTKEEGLPPVPPGDEPAACVLRIPLSAAAETQLEAMVRGGAPLQLHFRRVLRAHVPADWEDMNAKYFDATLPISLVPLAAPGSVAMRAEVPFVPPTLDAEAVETERNPKRKAAARKASKAGQLPTMYEDMTVTPHQYTAAGTRAVFSLRLHRTLTRLASDRVRPALTPAQLIPTRAAPAAATAATPDAGKALEEVIEEMAAQLVQEYSEAHPEHADGGATAEGREALRARFLDYFQSSGQLTAYQEKLTALVLQVIQQKFRTNPNATDEDVGRLQNELFVYLLERMHLALQRMTERGAPSAAPLPPDGDDEEERSLDPVDVWYQRALEAELTEERSLASSCHQARLASYEGGPRYAELWTDAAAFYTRVGDVAQAEVCYREAIASDPLYLPGLMGYGTWLLAYDRLREAAVFLHSAVDLASAEDCVPWGCIALLHDLQCMQLRQGHPTYTQDLATWRREEHDARQEALRRAGEGATADALYLQLARYALQLHHRELANICLSHCAAGDEVEVLYAALFVQAGQHREALDTLERLPQQPPGAQGDLCLVLRASCEAALGRTEAAVKLYKQALCRDNAPTPLLDRRAVLVAPSTAICADEADERRMTFLRAYLHLGNLLLGEGKYRDALGVFTLALQLWPSALLWLGAGITYYRSGNLEAAEECLSESNTIDPANPRTWAYLTLLVLRLQRPGLEDTLQQLRQHHLTDPSLWAEVGRELLAAERPALAEWCLCRAMALETERTGGSGKQRAAQTGLLHTTRYYLAQVLLEQQRWDEARELLEEVAAHSTNEVLKAKAEEELQQVKSMV